MLQSVHVTNYTFTHCWKCFLYFGYFKKLKTYGSKINVKIINILKIRKLKSVGGGRSTITVEAIAVETITVEVIAVEAIAVEVITVHPGGGLIDDHC